MFSNLSKVSGDLRSKLFNYGLPTVVEVTLEKVNHGKLITMVNGTASVTPNFQLNQEPTTRSLQVPHIPVTAFSQTDLFLV